MKRKPGLLIAAATLFGILLAGACLYAATTMPDLIKIDASAYTKPTKPLVVFNHKKHVTEYAKKYPNLFKNGCGQCHHDKNDKPLTNLKAGDKVQKCIACHKIPGKPPFKKADGSRLTKKEKLAYDAYALHQNCRECHIKYNRETGTRNAPTTCNKCHVKKAS